MKKRRILAILLCVLLVGVQGLFACTIFAVGKAASADGSTMISHTCDSTTDDLRVWLIPSMEAGVERDVVLNGRVDADYGNFPEVKDYGTSAMVLGTYTPKKATNQYLHAMYSFINDKGLAMGESTCSYDFSSEQGKKLTEVWGKYEGIYDCYMLQDLALENCSTAREAVEFMGSMIDEYGWNGYAECINICDGNEAWVFEAYGGNIWCAVRVPDNAVFVAANRARINHIDFNDHENYKYAKNIKSFALENGLWNGKGEFIPCLIYAPNPTRTYSTRREWIALSLLNSSLNLDPEEQKPDYNWPLFVVPDEKVSVDTIHKLSSNYYQGTKYDVSNTLAAGPFGNPLYPASDRTINSFRCTYIQIANVKSWLPEEVRCLAYFGWGAPDSAYLPPIWASQTELAPHFLIGVRDEAYNPESGWWVASLVQQATTANYQNAIKDLYAFRNPKLETQYSVTSAIQEQAAKLIENGDKEEAISLLTSYSNQQAKWWHEAWKGLGDELISKYMHGNIDMRTSQPTEWWQKNVVEAGLK